jgi:dTDP-4-amino-4,6-dideoxygalactose transaminase
MAGCLKPIGGEFWFQKELFNEKIDNFKNAEAMFLDGGQSSLHYIYKGLSLAKDEYILMPSYLCPSMIIGLERLNINYDFYNINKDLSIDTNSIDELMKDKKIRAVLFVNYFGFYHREETLNYLKSLKKKGLVLIEDAVQMLWFNKAKNFIGDFVFNSYRKFLPVDGSALLGKRLSVDISDEESGYAKTVSEARLLKTSFIKDASCEEENFLKLYSKAEHEYYENIVPRKMIFKNKEILNNCDLVSIKEIRIKNFKFLEKELQAVKEIEPLFKSINIKEAPLGFAVFAKNRDELRSFLRKYSIFAPVHWNLNGEVWATNYKDSLFVSNNILTIPIDQRYDYKDMLKIVELIKEFYNKEVEDL